MKLNPHGVVAGPRERISWDQIVPGLERVPTDIVPDEGGARDLGSEDAAWARLFMGPDGIDVNPGSDDDADLITVGVTGTPRFYWDESLDLFGFTHNVLGPSVLLDEGANGTPGLFLRENGTAAAEFAYIGSSARLDIQVLTAGGDIRITPGAGGTVEVATADGLDVSPGSDADTDLLTVGVTGAPRFWWDESEDAFSLTKKLRVTGRVFSSLGIDVYSGPSTDIDILVLGLSGSPKLWWSDGSGRFQLTHSLALAAAMTLTAPNVVASTSLRVDAGVALGGGSAATLGTIGGSGPASAGQAQWLTVNIGGTNHFIPAWT